MKTMKKDELICKYNKVFGRQTANPRVYFAPGRVNLIGEHIDYNGGYVFPCALTIGTYVVVGKRKDSSLRFYSENFKEDGIITSKIDIPEPDKLIPEEKNWSWYVLGVMFELAKKGIKLESGLDIYVYGNIPNKSGLSSSASLEVAIAYAVCCECNHIIDNKEIALLCKTAENEYNHVNCGIMDQFAIALGKKDCAIYLNTDTLDYRYVPIVLNDMSIVIACSNKKRGLGDSKYNQRRAECEGALEILKNAGVNINELCDLSCKEFEQFSTFIEDEVLLKRARHAVTENDRTRRAVEFLEKNDIKSFGELMKQSHISLRDDYEVTGHELDTLFEAAINQRGVAGSRMTGAGFGGCTVSLVENQCVNEFIENTGRIYKENTDYEASFYVVNVGDGPTEL